MAIVKTLIVKGVARFLTDAYMSTIRSGIWNGSTIQVGYGGTGVTSAKGDLYTPVFLSSSGIAACSAAIPHNTKDFKINGTTYSIFTTYTGTAPTIFAPTTLASTGGYILATNSAKTGLEWVAKPATNVTTSAVVASSATGTTLVSADQADPYYNLLEGGTVTRSILLKHGDDLSISSSTGGVITFSLPTRLKSLITTDTGTTIFNGFGRITSGGPFESFHTSNTDCMIVSTGYSSSYGGQLATDYRTSNIAYRAYNNGTWTDWALMASNKNTVNDNITVSWNSETTIATIAGIPIKIKIPANPDRRKAFYGTCATAAGTAAKVVTLSNTDGWVLVAGTIIGVKFTNTNTASSVTLNVNSSGAKSIFYDNAAYTGSSNDVCGKAGRLTYYMYDGTNWVYIGNSYVINTTYSAGTAALLQEGTNTTNRVWQAKILQDEFVSKRGDTMTGNLILNGTTCITSNTITDVEGYIMLGYNSGNILGAFGNGTTATIPTYIRSTGNNLYHKKGNSTSSTDHLIADAGNIVNDNTSVSWNTETTIATIAGVPIKIKIPANPNTWRSIRVNNGSSDSVGTGTGTKSMNFASTNLTINYLAAGTSTGQSGNANYFTIKLDAKDWTGATSSAAGTAGYMPGAASADRTKFLRGDGSWVALSLTDHTHSVKINGATKTIAAPGGTAVDLGSYVLLDAGAAEQTIKNSIGSLSKGSIEIWRAVASGYAMIGFANGTTKTSMGMLGLAEANKPIFRNTSGTNYLLAHAGNISLSANPVSIGWNTSTTIATIAGVNINVKIPANPNSWRNIYVGGSSKVGTGTGTKAMNFAVAGNLSVSYLAAGTDTGQSGSADYFTVKITANANAVGVAGYVAAPTKASNPNQVWMTNSDGAPAWRTISVATAATLLAKVTKTLAVSTWTDMAAVSTYSGTYAIQINSGNVYASGVFTACGGTDSVIDEIPLHVADKGTNTWRPYARISAGQLQMTTNEATGTARTYTIKILKLI